MEAIECIIRSVQNGAELNGVIEGFEELEGASNKINSTLLDLLNSGVIEWLSKNQPPSLYHACDDRNPTMYIYYAVFHAGLGRVFLSHATEGIESGDLEEFVGASSKADMHLQYMLDALTRPECLVFLGGAIDHQRGDDK
jgi:hypothetical protein